MNRTLLMSLLLAAAPWGISRPQTEAPADAAPAPPAVPESQRLYVYKNGSLEWPGDYSWNLKEDYRDKSGQPPTGKYDLAIQLTGPNGGWLPYASPHGPYLDVHKYTRLVFSLKPTSANQSWNVYFVAPNDNESLSVSVDPTKYGPKPAPGQWATYSIPLADMAVGPDKPMGKFIYKFSIHDQSGAANSRWYLSDVYFAP